MKRLVGIICLGVICGVIYVEANARNPETNATETMGSKWLETPRSIPLFSENPTGPVSNELTTAKETRSETFSDVLQIAQQLILQKKAIEESSDRDLHGTPKPTLLAAAAIGKLIELADKDPSRADKLHLFLKDCSVDPDVITVTRAQCAKYFVTRSKLAADKRQEFENQLPQAVKQLYEKLSRFDGTERAKP